MTTLGQDLRYGLRMLLRAPVVSAVAALSLALGIAANASIFAVLHGFIFAPLPYHDQESLLLVREGRQGETVDNFGGTPVGNYRDYEAGVPSFEAATLYTIEPKNLTGVDVPEQLNVVLSTPNLFEVLGVQPALGRTFRPEEGSDGIGGPIVLEHNFWKRRFLSDPDVLSRTLILDGAAHTIIGVMPEAFDMIPANVDVFQPTDFADQRENRTARDFISFVRLAPGATATQAQRELNVVWDRIGASYPEATRGLEVRTIAVRDFFPGKEDQKLILILTAVTLFGLLIACANVANLLLGRAEERQKEVAVRTALGAGRVRILRQLLTESVVLALIAGALGSVLSIVVVRWLQRAMPPEMPKAMIPHLDLQVLLATLAVSVLAGVVFGLAPALHASRSDLRDALGEGSRGGTAGRSRRVLRHTFVIGEFAVALALLTGAGFLVQAFRQLTASDPGFRQSGLLTFSITIDEEKHGGPERLRTYEDELLERLAAVPGVQGVAAMSSLPRGRGNPRTYYTVEDRLASHEAERPTAGLQTVSPGYVSVMAISMLQGRWIEDTDREDGQPVVVVSQSLVEREFPDKDPIGRTVALDGEETPRVIIGVVSDILQDRIQIAGRGTEAMYVPLAQKPLRAVSFAVRVPGDPASTAGDVRRAVWSVDPDQPVAQLRTLDDFIDESLAGPRAISMFLTAMAAIALMLAALGIYGVVAHSVALRQREIGIRMALGAGRDNVVGMIVRSGLVLAASGMVLGLPLAYVMYRFAASALNLFEGDVGVQYAGMVGLALGLVAVFATWLPARRASGVTPVAALRE